MKLYVLAKADVYSGMSVGAHVTVLKAFKSKPTMNDFFEIRALLINNHAIGFEPHGEQTVKDLISYGEANNGEVVIQEVEVGQVSKEIYLPEFNLDKFDNNDDKINAIKDLCHVEIFHDEEEDKYYFDDEYTNTPEISKDYKFNTLNELIKEMDGIYIKLK